MHSTITAMRYSLRPIVVVLACASLVACGPSSGLPDEVEEADDPLAVFMNLPSPEAAAALATERLTKEQEAISACMRQQGFDYQPFIPQIKATDFGGPLQDSSGSPVDAKTIATEYGLGITIQSEQSVEESAPNPNEVYMSTLVGNDLVKYQEALYGEALTDYAVVDSTDPEGTGCLHVGYRAATPPGLPSPDKWNAYRELLADIERRASESSEVLAASDAYQDCMAQQGFDDIRDPSVISEPLSRRWAQLAPSVPLERAAVEMAGSTELLSIQELERSVALANADCIGPWNNAYESARRPIELDVIEKNADLLASLKGYALSKN